MRYNEPGHAHSLTFSCYQRRPLLADDPARGWLLDAIATACHKHELDLWAYVVMPEHAHILLRPRREQYDVGKILSSMKQSVSKRVILHAKERAPSQLALMAHRQSNGQESFRFWQRGGGYDRNVWSPRYVWETIDYIHANPVRRRLCDRDIDWKWSSASAYVGLDDAPLAVQTETLPQDPRQLNAL